MKNNKLDLLPDGTVFEFWDTETIFTKTYHVEQKNPLASDDSPGTKERPFATISKAAGILKPGERVIVGEGIYREFIRPVNGGADRQHMISYEAIPGARVIITGAEVWNTEWKASSGWSKKNLSSDSFDSADENISVWMGEFPNQIFKGLNPFSMVNVPSIPWAGNSSVLRYLPKDAPFDEYLMRRGLLIVDGKPLKQVAHYYMLFKKPGTYWVEDNGLKVHFRLCDDGNPIDHRVEFTAREQLFSPAVPALSYVRVKGFTFEYAGNGYPGFQRGALSTNCGHHWIIEDNKVHSANSIGIDIGQENPLRHIKTPAGYHIIRRNTITGCGICGICGVPANGKGLRNVLMEDNEFKGNGWHNSELLFEMGSIKIHLARNCLIRNNFILDNEYGPAIWIDYLNENTRVCGNVIINCKYTMNGAVFVEASHKPNMVDGNIIWEVGSDPSVNECGTKGCHGVYEHDSDYITVKNNLIAHTKGAAVYMNLGDINRVVNGRGPTGKKHKVIGNIISNCSTAVVLPTPDNFCDKNIYGSIINPSPLRIQKPEERLNLEAFRDFHGWEANGMEADVEAELDRKQFLLRIKITCSNKSIKRTIDLKKEFNISELLENFT